MKRISKVFPFLIALLLVLPTLSLAGQFKVTRVYDGDMVEAMAFGVQGGS
jgi:hypothetical protein